MNLTSTMIEFSEHVGQKSLTCGIYLPIRTNNFCKDIMKLIGHFKPPSSSASEKEWDAYRFETCALNETYTLIRYRNLGIDIISKVDDLFYEVVLPDGWYIKSDSGSTYWSTLVNENGECICSIFYKDAPYDRDAFVNFKEDLA